MARRTDAFNAQMAVLYQDAVDNLRFLKQQQWNVTNYAALIYAAAIFLFSQHLLPEHSGKSLLVPIVAVTCLVNVFCLWDFQCNMRKFRDRVQWIYATQFTAGERSALKLEPRDRRRDRSIAVLLTFTTLLGALVTIAVLTT